MHRLSLPFAGSFSRSQLFPHQSAIFIAFLLFGQVFISSFAYLLGIDNRSIILPFRALIALYSLYIVIKGICSNKSIFLEAFPLSLTVFWFIYCARLLCDHFVFGVETALPVWEFFSWGVGGCFLPGLACYLLACSDGCGQFTTSVMSLGFLLLGCSALFFVLSVGINVSPRFELPSLNSINASHSFFILSLFAVSFLAHKFASRFKSLCAIVICVFGVSMGVYGGSRGAFLAFIFSSLIVFFASGLNKRWVLVPLIFSALLLAQFDPSGLVARLTAAGSDLGSVLRLSAIYESIRVFGGHPLFGAGFSFHLNLATSLDYVEMWYPHNLISESLALGGLILTFPLLVCVFLSVRSCLVLLGGSSSSELWRIALLVQAFAYATFSGHLGNVPLFWVALGLISSIAPFGSAKSQS